jgi:hypothetical protein
MDTKVATETKAIFGTAITLRLDVSFFLILNILQYFFLCCELELVWTDIADLSKDTKKPSFVARFLGIFKKSKVPEEVIQEPKSEEDASMELKEDTPEEPILEEAIQDTEVQPDQAEVVAETDVPDVQTEEAIEEESVSIKDKIVEFFKPTETAVEETEEQLIEEEEPIVSEVPLEEESVEESTSIKDKIVGFFKKAEEAKVETVIEEPEDKDVAVEMHADDNIVEETTAEEEIIEDEKTQNHKE